MALRAGATRLTRSAKNTNDFEADAIYGRDTRLRLRLVSGALPPTTRPPTRWPCSHTSARTLFGGSPRLGRPHDGPGPFQARTT